MATIQIKNVPDETHRVLRSRATSAHQSLQEYLLTRLIDEAAQPTIDEVFAAIEEQSGGRVSLAEATDAVRADRDSR